MRKIFVLAVLGLALAGGIAVVATLDPKPAQAGCTGAGC